MGTDLKAVMGVEAAAAESSEEPIAAKCRESNSTMHDDAAAAARATGPSTSQPAGDCSPARASGVVACVAVVSANRVHEQEGMDVTVRVTLDGLSKRGPGQRKPW